MPMHVFVTIRRLCGRLGMCTHLSSCLILMISGFFENIKKPVVYQLMAEHTSLE